MSNFLDIYEALKLSNLMKQLLGPNSKDQVLTDKDGSTTITNDGATVLNIMVC